MSIVAFPSKEPSEQPELLGPDELVTRDEAAALLGCAPITVRRLVQRGELETLYSGRLLRVTKRSIAAYQQRTRKGGRAA